MKLVIQERIILKNNPEINEKVIQDYIFENPSVLGLGDLEPLKKEKVQPLGGRLDLLFADDDNNRYEVELQLGATDPSHIIRTLEYWDTERKRYPQYNHKAVIIAEDITSRFQNVISLFNGSIPIIALQLNAVKTTEGDISLSFVKVMDIVELGADEEDYAEPTDRAYWEKRSTNKTMQLVDKLANEIGVGNTGYDLKYNKFYIGLQKDGVTKNYVSFRPKKSFLYLDIKSEEMPELEERLASNDLDVEYKWQRYNIKINKYEDFQNNREDIEFLINNAKNKYNIE